MLSFLIYNDLKKKNPTSVQDNQTLSSNLDCAFTDLSQHESRGYWLWHDLLDILDILAPYEQDWIDYPQQERERIKRVILHPYEFCNTCWYWLGLLINGIDEIYGERHFTYHLDQDELHKVYTVSSKT